ncbi:MAG: glycosyl hydrolase, partial [Flavobacteriales bacterium]|nr:glycosyl hydrolase [Flavobacteriales bacterium]
MPQLKKVFILLLLVSFAILDMNAQVHESNCLPPPYLKQKSQWADSVLQSLSLEQKVGQLFMVAAYSNKDEKHAQFIDGLIENQHIGGLIFMQGGPIRQAHLTNRYQANSEVPLLIAMDAEWGLAMRLDSTVRYPRQMSIGAAADESLAYAYGQEMGRQLNSLGVHVSFSPVVDVNNNPNNPVIGSRSFGENREQVALLGTALMKGLQSMNVLANAKHFPGHGDTDQDSHLTLPSISHGISRLDSIELYPFKHMIRQGLGSMMIAHLNIPALDSTTSTLSSKIIKDLLREEMAFDGLIFTDALNMKGVSSYYQPGELDLKALEAGNDILLFPGNVPKASQLIIKAVQDGVISEEELDEHVLRILQVKDWTGAALSNPIATEELMADLNSRKATAMLERLIESSLTVVKNDGILPLKSADQKKIAVLTIGTSLEKTETFRKTFSRYGKADFFKMRPGADFATIKKLTASLSSYDQIVINLVNTSNSPKKKFGVSKQGISMINDLKANSEVHINWFGNPYAINHMPGAKSWNGLLIVYH